jgi:uncharacterized protein (DUF2384 family)
MAVASPPREFRSVLDAEIPPDQLARLTDKSERTARRWLAGETEPRGEMRTRIAEISAVLDAYRKTFPQGHASAWIERPNPHLDFRSPRELVAEGQTREVLALLTAIGEGVHL